MMAMDTVAPQPVSSLPAPPPRPPLPEHRTDGPGADPGPGWLAVGITVVAQIVWLGVAVSAWLIALVVAAWSGSEGLIGAGGADDAGRWMVLVTLAAMAAAPIPTVAFIATRRHQSRRSSTSP